MGRFSKLDFNEEAPGALSKSVDHWPDLDEKACLEKGDEFFDSGFYDDALTAYSRALRFNKDLPDAWTGQLRCLIQLNELPEALTWCDRAMERFPKSADVLACKGLALVLLGEQKEGLEFLDGAVQMRSPSPWVWLARGQALLETKGGVTNANRCFLKTVELAPQAWRWELRIGMALNGARKFAEARPYLRRALQSAPGNALVLLHNGLMCEGSGEFEQAAGLFERALAARRGFGEAQSALERVRSLNPVAKWWRKLKS